MQIWWFSVSNLKMYYVCTSLNYGECRENVALGGMLMGNIWVGIESCSLPGAVSSADGIVGDVSLRSAPAKLARERSYC